MKIYIIIGVLAVIMLASIPSLANAQHREDSIEESWARAAREKARQTQPESKPSANDAQYKWSKGQQQQVAKEQPHESKWPVLPENPTNQDLYRANSALIDSLTNMYCVSTTYLRTLRNRNEAARVHAPPPQPVQEQQDDRFKYEKDSWNQKEQQKQAAPPPVKSQALSALNQELFQLLDKCLNR